MQKVDSTWLESVQRFRANREASLRKEYGWLSLAGLFWLKEGGNAFGSAGGNPVRLPERAPAHGGVFTLTGNKVTVTGSDAELRVNDAPIANDCAVRPDTSREPNFVFVGDIRLGLIERGGQLAIRVWDPLSPVRRNFGGCVWFDPDSKWRVRARIETYVEPKRVLIDDIIGIQRPAMMHAALAFEMNGTVYKLDAELQEDNSYYIIFRDKTAGDTTYSAGRYLTTEIAEKAHVAIDFNLAYNPPCAFTDFATCPLPPAQNILPIAIEAGEKFQTR